ncbi:MAG: hypothetical protein KAI83_07785 [Thiomargarita sp.]|nr:hypothetical protein [Thiomargarita sp.]
MQTIREIHSRERDKLARSTQIRTKIAVRRNKKPLTPAINMINQIRDERNKRNERNESVVSYNNQYNGLTE